MPTYPFLSDEWIDEARKIREEYRGRLQPLPAKVRMNQVITEVPFGDGSVDASLDTTSGELELELGHLDKPDVTITVDYPTARAIFVEQNPEAAMQAFMSGRIKVQGDITKLLAMQQVAPDPLALEVAGRVKAITA